MTDHVNDVLHVEANKLLSKILDGEQEVARLQDELLQECE